MMLQAYCVLACPGSADSAQMLQLVKLSWLSASCTALQTCASLQVQPHECWTATLVETYEMATTSQPAHQFKNKAVK